MLSLRILSGFIFFAVFFLALFQPAFAWALPLILTVTALWGTHEFMHFGKTKPTGAYLALALAAAAGLIGDAYWFQLNHALPIIGLTAMLALSLATLRHEADAAEIAALSVTGPVYVALPLALSTLIWHIKLVHVDREGQYYLIFLVAVTWAGDIGAYFFGRFWGRHKMAPRISPGKTVEGLIGGILLTLAVAVGLKVFWRPIHAIFVWREIMFLALAFSIIGPIGDLVESWLKRSSGIKDSGRTFTGHGGMLDIIDSILFTTVFYYGYLLIFHAQVFHFVRWTAKS